ncbi:MAG: hypothetical protein F6K36_28655 [Symploca sp. SIO3C6]|nr:hypothetical protein [Symploca sp. SIO3C6]
MSDSRGWEYTQRVIRITHNRRIREHFSDIESDDDFTTGRSVLRNTLLIRDNDSGLEVMNKQACFRNLLDDEPPVATMPEHWERRVGSDRPQLVVVYRPKLRRPGYTGNYQLSIPHYIGGRKPNIPSYKKGNWHGILTLTDNSKLTVNGVTMRECERVIKIFKRYINPKYLPGNFKIGEVKGKPYHEFEIKPIRADFYSHGRKNLEPDWRYYCK